VLTVQGPSLDLQALMDRAHFAFRPEGADFAAAHSSYDVRVSSAGRMQLRARAVHEGKLLGGASLSVETASLSRGATTLHAGKARAARVAEDGALLLDRGAASETLANRDAGVEQSWRFATPPAGDGDLVVRVRLSGLTYTTETEHGLHFLDPRTGLGFRYGVATWIDAGGRRVTLRPRLDGGEVALVVPADVLASSRYPAVLDPIVSPEYGTDAPVSAASNGVSDASSTSVVYGGGTYLVTWTDSRGLDFAKNYWIYAARVGTDGAVSDPLGIPIGSAGVNQLDPQAAFDGTHFLIVWDDRRTTDFGIYGQFLSTGGQRVGPNFVITKGSLSGSKPSVAFTGTAYEVVWTDKRNQANAGDEIWGARVTQSGGVTERRVALNAAPSGYQYDARIACDGRTVCLVAWHDKASGSISRIRGVVLNDLGETVASELAISDPAYGARV
jgi:hypothetical protein